MNPIKGGQARRPCGKPGAEGRPLGLPPHGPLRLRPLASRQLETGIQGAAARCGTALPPVT